MKTSNRFWVILIGALFILCAAITAAIYFPRSAPGPDASSADPGPDASSAAPGPDVSSADPGPDISSAAPEPTASSAVVGPIAIISMSGEVVDIIDLGAVTETSTRSYTGEYEITNVVEIAPGQIRVQSADCPDQVCVYQGWMKENDILPIICLPNAFMINITSVEKE